jgi:hypothetical protein
MFQYNYYDVVVLHEIVSKKNIISDIINLCKVSNSPFIDAATYKTGVLSWNCVSSFAIYRNYAITWPKEKRDFVKIRGGEGGHIP